MIRFRYATELDDARLAMTFMCLMEDSVELPLPVDPGAAYESIVGCLTDGVLIIGEIGQEVVCVCGLQLFRYWASKEDMWLDVFTGVRPDHRGESVMSELVVELGAWADETQRIIHITSALTKPGRRPLTRGRLERAGTVYRIRPRPRGGKA